MTDWTLSGRLGTQLTIDVCAACQAFWFDQHKDLQLSPGSTLELMKYIGEHSSARKPAFAQVLPCPVCGAQMTLAHNMTRNVHFVYWHCASEHGHLIAFIEFLKEKNFIRPLSPVEIQHLRESVQTVKCASCGAAVDLRNSSECPYCHAPISILDLKQQQQMLAELKEAAAPKPVDPTLPMKLVLAKEQTSALFQEHDPQWWEDARSGDLIQAGLNAVSRWLSNRFVS
ncbi:MAG TPA: hypothetical protein VJN93_02920 [Candidatus Acidoferrum sp.]|nr:hypothetical protein [Candidatus Acidoferrum sp.]